MSQKIKKIVFKVIEIYSLGLSVALLLVSLNKIRKITDLLFPILFLPLGFYFTKLFKHKKKINLVLFVYNLLFTLLVFVANVLAIKKITDLLLTATIIPMVVYFVETTVREIGLKVKLEKLNKSNDKKDFLEKQIEMDKKIIDKSKRKFIKMLAGTSIATALLFLFNKKDANAAFLGSMSGPGTFSIKDSAGEKVDPAINSPLDGYAIANIEETVAINYFGFTNKIGKWYIMRVNNVDSSFLYYRGDTEYSSGWDNRIIESNFKTFAETF